MKIRNVLIAIFLLSLANIVMQPILAQGTPVENASLRAPSNETELVSFVESAVAHVHEVGKGKAIKDFMDLNGSWVRGDVYIFAHDFNGTTLCLPYLPKEVGTNRLDIKNDQGIYINREMRSIALNGSGFYEYSWPNPISNQSESKISYVTKVDDTWWLGSGIYGAKSNSGNATVRTHLGGIAGKERDLPELETDNKMAFLLVQLQSSIQGQLNDLDLAVADSSHKLSAVGIGGEKARSILRNLTSSSPYFAEATTGSPEGKIVMAEPAVYKNSEGADISKNDVTIQLMDTKSPVFSQVFRLVEGYDASVVAYPVFSPSGEFIGGVGAIIKPADFLGSIIAPQLKGTNYSVTVMQKDGLALYDPDPSQVGKMLFDDPMFKPYPQLLTLGKKMVAERSGKGSYVFLNKQHDRNVTKEVYWTTVGLHGIEWRLAATRIAG
jgi:hypothetical protein